MAASDEEVEKSRMTVLVFAYFFALLLRLLWIHLVQHPDASIRADMAGYVNRGASFLPSGPTISPESLACFPYGTHTLYGLEQLLFGLKAYGPMAIVQAALNAMIVPFTMALAWRAGLGLVSGAAVGAAVTVWPPTFIFSSYFSSETPYMASLIPFCWAWLRWLQTGRGAWLTGLLGAIAFTIRPQVILTIFLGLILVYWIPRASIQQTIRRTVPTLLFPILMVLTFSVTRQKALTDSYGLISTNSQVARFFADTEYRRISVLPPEKEQDDPDAKRLYFHPPARSPDNGFKGDFEYTGKRCDDPQLDEERRRWLEGKGLRYRIGLIQRNIELLFHRNELWPERNHWDTPSWRKPLVEGCDYIVLYVLAPLTLFAFLGLRHGRHDGLEWLVLHLFTMLFSAAYYFGEVRYRVSYDPLLFVMAAIGIQLMTRGVKSREAGLLRRWTVWVTAALGAALLFGPWTK